MITAVVLGLYAAMVGYGAPRLLPRLWRSDRAPRRTVALLLILSYSLPLSAITGAAVFGCTMFDMLARIDPRIDDCADRMPINDSSRAAPVLGGFALLVATGLTAWIGFCLVAAFTSARARRRSHAAVLRLAGRHDGALDAMVLDHERAASYCLPGRPGRIVVTTKAIRLLTGDQLGAVLAHERAHLRGHHHLVLTFSSALRRAMPGMRLIVYTDREVRALVELIADDAAARDHGSRAVAGALAVIGAGHVPGGVLGVVGGPGALARINRLTKPDGMTDRRGGALFGVLVLASAVAIPIMLATGSVAMLFRDCPPSTGDERSLAAVSAPRWP